MMHLLKFCFDPFPARCFWCSAVVNTQVTLLVTICSYLGPGNETISTLVQRNEIWERDCNYSSNIYACESLHLIMLFYLFFCKLCQEAWIIHRASSTTRSRKEKRKKKRKLEIQILTKTTTLQKRQKNSNENRTGEDVDKKSTSYTIEQAVQWPTSVEPNIHTKGLGGADVRESLCVRMR